MLDWMPEARASTACEHDEAVVLAAAAAGVSRVRRDFDESAEFLVKREGRGRPETALRKVRMRMRSDFILAE
jgi:hypothetical protein